MMKDIVSIRKADISDVNQIYALIVSDNIMWSEEDIRCNIENLFILVHDQNILAVLNGCFDEKKEKIFWVAAHPFYPKSSLKSSIVQGLWGVICKKPEEDKSWDINNKADSISGMMKIFFKNIAGANKKVVNEEVPFRKNSIASKI